MRIRKYVMMRLIKEMMEKGAPAPESVSPNLVAIANKYYDLIDRAAKEYNLRVRMIGKWVKASEILEGEAYEAGIGIAPAQLVYLICENHKNHHLALIFYQFEEGLGDPYCTIIDANEKYPIFTPQEVDDGFLITHAFYLDLINHIRPRSIFIFLPSGDSPYYSIGTVTVTAEGEWEVPIASPDGSMGISVDEWREVQARSLYGNILTK